jgi:hypothetical protein
MCGARVTLAIFIGTLLGSAAPVPAQELPPPGRPLEFTSPQEGWPPRVSGESNVEILPAEPVAVGLTPASAASLGRLAANSPHVRRFLGDRYAFIEADLLEREKGEDRRPLKQRVTSVMFYSYSRNVAVRALVRGGKVLEVSNIEGYQPPESSEEIERAIELARRNAGLGEAVAGLEGRGLLTERAEGQTGAGHRLLYVSFMAPDSARFQSPRTKLFALVDLTEDRVLEAGLASRQ